MPRQRLRKRPEIPYARRNGQAGRTPMTSKITRKQFLASVAGLAVAMPAIWRSGRAFAQGAVTLKLGHPDTPLHPTQTIATKFSELVAAKTGGAVRIQVFSGGQLGSEVNIVSGMQTGIVDMAFHTTGFLESFFPRIQVLDLPFLFRDAKTAEAVLDGPIGQGLLGDMPAKGIYGFVWGHYGWRETETASQPVREPSDLKGLKIRIQPGAVFAASFRACGAIPVVMDLSEVYIGISQKTVGGVELPFLAIVSSKIYEVTKFAGLTNHVYNAGAVHQLHAWVIRDVAGFVIENFVAGIDDGPQRDVQALAHADRDEDFRIRIVLD